MKQIQLTQGKVVLVDDVDFEHLNQWKWFASKSCRTWYAMRTVNKSKENKKRKTILMHKQLMNTPDNMATDHINGDGLNNCRSNLRICTDFENAANRTRAKKDSSSGVPGVTWKKDVGKWCAKIMRYGESIFLGYFNDKDRAIHRVNSYKIAHARRSQHNRLAGSKGD